MLESIKSFLLLTILIYAIILTVLYWTEYTNKQKYMQDKTNSLKYKETELENREKTVIDKEMCFRELTKLQTIQTSAMDLLKSYAPIKLNDNNKHKTGQENYSSIASVLNVTNTPNIIT